MNAVVRAQLLRLLLTVWSGLFDPDQRWSYRAFAAFVVATAMAVRGIELSDGWVAITQWFVGGEALRMSAVVVGRGISDLGSAIADRRVAPGATIPPTGP